MGLTRIKKLYEKVQRQAFENKKKPKKKPRKLKTQQR